jgi:hypothetical protein
MHPCIPHLLADINAAHRTEHGEIEEKSPTSIEEELEEIERLPAIFLAGWVGVSCFRKAPFFMDFRNFSSGEISSAPPVYIYTEVLFVQVSMPQTPGAAEFSLHLFQT